MCLCEYDGADINVVDCSKHVTLHLTSNPQVHHHPALKLKTPIAYQKDTDLNAIPIMREGMGEYATVCIGILRNMRTTGIKPADILLEVK